MQSRLWSGSAIAVAVLLAFIPCTMRSVSAGIDPQIAAVLPVSACATVDDRAVLTLLAEPRINRRTESRPAGSRLRFNGATTTSGREVACRWETPTLTFEAIIGRPDGRDTTQTIARATSLYRRVVRVVGGRPSRARKVATSGRRGLGDAASDIVISGKVRERHLIFRAGTIVVELNVLGGTDSKAVAPVPSGDALAEIASSLLTRITPARSKTSTTSQPTATTPAVVVTTPSTIASIVTSTNVPLATGPAPTTTLGPGATLVVVAPANNVLILAVELLFEDPSPGGQAVWLANRSTADVDVSCWVVSTASGGKATVAAGTHIGAERVLRLATPTGMLRASDTVTLIDRTGREVDRTPQLSDTAVDDRFWFRDGDTWRFGRTVYSGRVSDGRLTTIKPAGC